MEKVEVKVLSLGVEYDVYVNRVLVRSVATFLALKKYLRWLWSVNYDNLVTFDLRIFVPEFQKELRDYIFG